MKDNALALFDYAGMAQAKDNAGVVFKTVTEPIMSKDGTKKVGEKTVVSMVKQALARETLQLKGKDNADQWQTVQNDAKVFAFRRLKLHLNSMDETRLGLLRYQEKTGPDGLMDMSFRVKEVPMKQSTLTIEQVAEAFGITRDEAIAKFAKDGVKPKFDASTDISSSVVPPAQLSDGVRDLVSEAQMTDAQAAKNEEEQLHAQAAADSGKKNKSK